ncbi:MAG: hypothetical protein QOI80_2122 [Solirubrobacteraceae bacterium]|nr:hypothetical protein [Solirubrobacteraceae bacterium]
MATSVVVGPAGVFVIAAPRGRASRLSQARELRHEVRRVRNVLDAFGLRALPATGVADLELDAVQALARSDERFGPATVRRARAALGLAPAATDFPFVADVATPAAAPARHPAATPAPSAAAPART